jgi:SAM-dependent methyltransferase
MKERIYLREVQYRDDTNLNARSALHERFSVNLVGLQRWVFDQLDLPARARILEVGCGPGNLWAANLTRTPQGWQIVLSDFSAGMVQAACRRLSGRRFVFEVADAEAVPHRAGTFDAVIANHMLYHVSDRRRAIAEFGEVLKPSGVLYAVTNGLEHMREIDDLMAAAGLSEAGARHSRAFGLETGGDQLRSFFGEVEVRHYEDRLEVTDPDAIVAYVLSMSVGRLVDGGALRRDICAVMERDGLFRVSKATGMFVARSPLPLQP